MNILILGSEGFIGNHLVQWFLNKKVELTGCDLYEAPRHLSYNYIKVSRLSPQWDEVFSDKKFDVCVNAAGSGNVSYSMQHPLIDFESNTLDVVRILDAIRKRNNECKYLHISSAAVYGNPAHLPISESDASHPLSAYGWHKLMSEMACAEYSALYQIKTAIIRPFSVYGEGLRKQLLWDMCKRLKESDHIQLFGTGKESRDFIHISDLAILVGLLFERASFTGEVYNAGCGEETSIASVARLFEANHRGRKKISFSGEVRAGDPLNWRANVSRIQSLGFSCSVSFEKGVGDYIRWFDSLPAS